MNASPLFFQENGTICKTERLADGIHRITLRCPQIAIAARPGQFVMVRLGQHHDPLLRRPFSIHQTTAEGLLQILFKVVGKGTKILASAQPQGDMDVVGPLGHGFDLAGPGPAFLAGGGMGVAPLFFLAKTMACSSFPRRLVVLIGARTKEEIVGAKDFEALGAKVFLATDDGSAGRHGLVTDLIPPLATMHPFWSGYACGPLPMLRQVARQCADRDWQCQVSLETFMACGLGACLGCAMPRPTGLTGYLHVCKEGPVLDATEVGW